MTVALIARRRHAPQETHHRKKKGGNECSSSPPSYYVYSFFVLRFSLLQRVRRHVRLNIAEDVLHGREEGHHLRFYDVSFMWPMEL